MIPYGRQEVTAEDINSVVEVLKSDFLTQGPMVQRFEKIVADYVSAKHAIAVNSATSALHIACLALELGPLDWLWTSPITFVASSNCGLYCGAQVDFVDIDPLTYNICIKSLESKLIKAKQNNCLPKILVAVHLSGQPCDMAAIKLLSNSYGFKVIEDASHAIGADYMNVKVGNCRYSDITVFSFHPVKIITTAEGGLATTNDDELASRMELLRSHGITRDDNRMTHLPDGPWYYQQIALGYNYRMTDMQAALGASQMQRLDSYVAKRHVLSNRYDRLLKGFPITTPLHYSDSRSSLHLYIIRLHLNQINKTHLQVFEGLRKGGIGVNIHYIPVHMHPYYQSMGFKIGDFPEAERYYSEAISLPLHQTLTETEQDKVIEVLGSVLT